MVTFILHNWSNANTTIVQETVWQSETYIHHQIKSRFLYVLNVILLLLLEFFFGNVDNICFLSDDTELPPKMYIFNQNSVTHIMKMTDSLRTSCGRQIGQKIFYSVCRDILIKYSQMGTKFERKSNLFANLGLQILATNEIPKEEEFYQKEEFRQIDK